MVADVGVRIEGGPGVRILVTVGAFPHTGWGTTNVLLSLVVYIQRTTNRAVIFSYPVVGDLPPAST